MRTTGSTARGSRVLRRAGFAGRAGRWAAAAALGALGALGSCQCEDAGIFNAPGAVQVRLCSPSTGLPEAGHELTVVSRTNAVQEQVQTAQSGDDGWARLGSVPSGDITVKLAHRQGGSTRVDRERKDTLEQDETKTYADAACRDFPLAPGRGGIQGQVCNRHTGTLLQDATVTARLEDGSTLETRTDAGGFFQLADVPPGDHVVTIRADGFQRSFPARVEAGEVTRLELGGSCRPFDPGTTGNVGGRLCINNGEGPWALARVSITLGDGAVLEDVTDVEGRFLLEGVPPGAHVLNVQGGGEMATYDVTVETGQTASVEPQGDCPVPGDDTGEVRGQLCDSMAGGWLVGANAQVTQNGRTLTDTTDERGRFHFAGLQPGSVDIRVQKGAAYDRTFSVPIQAGQTVTVADGVCAPPTWQCQDQALSLEDAAPLRIMLLVDKSGSMEEAGLDGQKWSSAVNALTQVTNQLQGVAEFGLALFPEGDAFSASCDRGQVEVAPARNNAVRIQNAMESTDPGGGTPTGASVAEVHRWLVANPSETTSLVILATDGVPNCNAQLSPATCFCPVAPCPGSLVACCQNDPRECCLQNAAQCLDDDASVSAVRAMFNSGVRTYVIGLPGSEDPTDVLSRMAEAGGTNAGGGRAYYRPTSTQGLVDDMTDIVQSNRSCRFDLSAAPNDPQLMEVTLDGSVVPRDPGRRAGWDLVGTRGVELFGAACRTLRTGTQHDISVHFCTDA